MTGHEAEASALFCQGCNCAQAVFTAFCDVTGMDRQTALRLSSSFGAGMGRLRQTCGAVSAMCMVAGMLYGFGEHCDTAEKARHYARIQALAGAFQEQFGLTVSGLVGPITWDAIASLYSDLRYGYNKRPGQYPGYELNEGE